MNCYDTSSSSGNDSWRYAKVPKPTGTKMTRALEVAKYLMEYGGLTKIQAAAVVGVYIDENGCNPSTHMAAEKNGKGAKGTGGFGYGAGIASWTHTDFKNESLTQAGFAPYTAIETLSLQDQAKMVVGNIKGNLKTYYNALKRCTNIEDASATAVAITGGVGYVKKGRWKTHPIPEDGQHISDVYCRANNARFGESEHHCSLYGRRLAYAKQVLEELS